MSLNDAVTHRQTQSRSMRSFGREERFKDLLSNVFRHSQAVVFELKLQRVFVTATLYRQLAPFGHSVHCVDDQIHEDFAKFGSASISAANMICFELDLVLETAKARFIFPTSSCDFHCVIQKTADVHDLKLFGRRLARECLDSTYGRGGIFSSGLNDSEVS